MPPVGTAECLGRWPLDTGGSLEAKPGGGCSQGRGAAELGQAATAKLSGESGSGLNLLRSGIKKGTYNIFSAT